MAQPKLSPDKHRAATGVTLPKPLFAILKAYCEAQRYKAVRTAIIETAIREFLECKAANEPRRELQPKRHPDKDRVTTGVRLPKPLFAALNAYCEAEPDRPHRSFIIEIAIREFLEREGAYRWLALNSTAVASQSASVVSPPASASP
jgi:metal-responsive CopG/Arc/MetJ family transcriptional regulator